MVLNICIYKVSYYSHDSNNVYEIMCKFIIRLLLVVSHSDKQDGHMFIGIPYTMSFILKHACIPKDKQK